MSVLLLIFGQVSLKRAAKMLVVALLSCLIYQADAQQYRVDARQYSLEAGLPHRQVNSVVQDHRGLIWAATNSGVVRFDGRRFKVFNRSESGLCGERADWLAEAADGYIWAYQSQPTPCLDIIDPISGQVTPAEVFFKKQQPPIAWGRLQQPPQRQADGSLWMGLEQPGGCLSYHPDKGWRLLSLPQYSYFHPAKITSRQSCWGIAAGKDLNTNALVEMDTRGKVLRQYTPAAGNRFSLKKGGAAHPDVFFVLEGSPSEHNIIWEILPDGSRRVAPSFVNYTFTPQYARVAGDRLTVQFPGIFDATGRCLLDLQQLFPELDHNQYGDYLEDKSGNIWLGTAFGLILVELAKDHFKRYLFSENAPGGRGYACRGLLEQDGFLTVNVETLHKGRFRVDTRNGEVQRLPGAYAIGIAAASDGNIWTEFGRPDSGWYYIYLAKTNPEGRVLGPVVAQKKNDGGSIWAIFEKNKESILLGHSVGMSVYHLPSGRLEPWRDSGYPVLEQAGINSIQRSRSGDICVCSTRGFFRLQSGGKVRDRYWSGGQGTFYLPYDNILSFYEDTAGVFWLGTGGGGLIRWAPPFSARVQEGAERAGALTFSREQGLLNGVVYAVYEDEQAHLWLPTDYGIAQFDKSKRMVRRTWLRSSGLTHNEFNRTSHCQGSDGVLYFGGLNGVTAFHPRDFYRMDSTGGAQLVVTDFSVLKGGSGLLEHQTATLLQSGEMRLYPGDRYCQLEFALLDYTAPEQAIYAWQLEGISAGWETLKAPELRLSTLPYGLRRLRIRAMAADGSRAANELVFELYVVPPFYRRWWFALSLLLLLAGGIRFWLFWQTRSHRKEQKRLEAEVHRQTATIRRQSEELQKLDAAKSRFFANVSHELRTPLTLLLGPLGSMLRNGKLTEKDREHTQMARQQGEQLLGLVNEILDLSKMEAGAMQLHEAPIALTPFLHRISGDFESLAEQKGIAYHLDCRLPAHLRILADPDKLQKILNNLLANALKFTPAHTHASVTVIAEDTGTYVRVGVHDSGRGIHPEDLPHVFERFYQAQHGTPTLEGGAGIGLALCRELVALMQGRIWAESPAIGSDRGSSFYVEWPKKELSAADAERAGKAPLPAPALPRHTPVPTNQPNTRLLIVDDNDHMRAYLNTVLSGFYAVHTAEHGQAALAQLKEGTLAPDLIISDVMMPVMDGFQLLNALKQSEQWRHIPVVMLTARADLRDKLRALRIGVDDYLLKPFEEEELLARVDNLLKNHRVRVQGARSAPTDGDNVASSQENTGVSREDQAWLEQLEQLVSAALADSRLNADWLAQQLFVGRNLFYKKVKRLTGLTPNEYISAVRMTRARQLLETRQCRSVKEAAYSVGLHDVKYFSAQFRQHFGKLPSSYL